MKLNRITLAFCGPFEELEKSFLTAYFRKYTVPSKILHSIAIFFYMGCGLIDIFLFPDIKYSLLTIRCTTCGIFILGYFCSDTRFFARVRQFLHAFYVFIAGVSFIAIMTITPQPLNYSYTAGVMICIVFGYMAIRVRFIISLLSCWLIFLCYEIAIILILDAPLPFIIASSYYLVAVTALGMIVAYTLEYSERKDFYKAHVLNTTNHNLTHQIEVHQLTEDKLTASLKKKEIYLKEIHHRVKNNLQVISSLLDMMCSRSDNPIIQKTLMGARAKIQAMSLVHHQLYKNENVHKIDMCQQIKDLYHNLSMVYGSGCHINAAINVNDVFLTLDRAMPCALVMNELISNALEHAFVGRSRGILDIWMRQQDNETCLSIHDNGIGLPQGLDTEKIDSLGLRLVQILVEKQLKGDIQMTGNDGTTFTIRFDSQVFQSSE